MSRVAGLWFTSLSARIEDVSKAHKKECCDCAQLPEVRRLVVKKGNGRRATTEVRCQDCGRAWLHKKEVEAGNAKNFLATGEGEIRCL